jgi:hypothetical protein
MSTSAAERLRKTNPARTTIAVLARPFGATIEIEIIVAREGRR